MLTLVQLVRNHENGHFVSFEKNGNVSRQVSATWVDDQDILLFYDQGRDAVSRETGWFVLCLFITWANGESARSLIT